MKSHLLKLLLTTSFLLCVSCVEKNTQSEPFRAEDNENRITLYEQKDVDAASLQSYGEYLAKGPASCGYCHGDGTPNGELIGGRVIKSDMISVIAPALKDNPLLNSWSEEQLIRAIRTGERENNSDIPNAMHGGYRWMSNSDLRAILAYLRPVNKARELKSLDDLEPRGFFTRSFEGSDSVFEGYVPIVPRSTSIQYGRYLSFHVARCQVCHSAGLPLLSDDEAFTGSLQDNRSTLEKISSTLRNGISLSDGSSGTSNETPSINFPGDGPNIRGSSGELKNWSADDIVKYLTNGVTQSGKQINGDDCPWPFYSRMNGDDKLAIAKYLKTL